MTPGRAVAVVAVVAAVGAVLLWRGQGGERGAPAPGAAPPSRAPLPGKAADRAPAVPVELAGPLALAAATSSPAPDASAGELAGRVLDWGTGEPVGGAELAIAAADGGAISSFVADAGGQFVIRPPAPASYRIVSVLADGYLPWAPDPGTSPLVMVARPGIRVDGVVVYLVPAIRYHGVVVDPDGAPIAGAAITLLDADAGERARAPLADRFVSDADGRFTFQAPDDALLEARKDGFAPGRARVDAAVAISRQLTIRLGPAAVAAPVDLSIAGTVVTAAGAAVGDARVTAIPAGGWRELRRGGDARSDADGRFALDRLDAGRYWVRAVAPGRATTVAEVDAGAADVRLVLGDAHRIAGVVVAPDGAPVPAATVAVVAPVGLVREVVAVSTVFDASGRFVIDDLPAGDYRVIAQAHGFAPSADVSATASPDLAPAPITVPLRAGATLFGRVIDADRRRGLDRAKVSVEGSLGDGSSAVPLATTAITATDGSFELAGIAPGRRSITAGASGHHLMIVGPLDVAEGARHGPITIELTPTAPGETPRIELAGIGATLAADGDALRVEQVVPGGGADTAGLAAGDLVLAVDGVPVTELGLDGAIQRIRGPVGTQVVLRIRRGDAAGPSDVTVTRVKIRA
jgi:hypothetical protein